MYLKINRPLLFYIFLFTFVTNQIFAQPGDKSAKETGHPAIFRVLYQFDQKAEKNEKSIIVTDIMALTVGKQNSIYYDWHRTKKDSLVTVFMHNEIMSKGKQISVLKSSPFESKLGLRESRMGLGKQQLTMFDESQVETLEIFKNRSNNEIVSVDDGPVNTTIGTKQDLILTETIPFENWEITDDTITILNYLCHKATTFFRGRDYVAWFTQEIPVNDGPWKLYGLPGLILKAEDTENIFSFEAVGIQQLENEKIEMPKNENYISTTFEELRKFRKNKVSNISQGIMDDNGLTIYNVKNPIKYNDLELNN